MAVRIDKWLWAVRLTKTRARANEAASAGRVKVNDNPAKPATKVKVGDVIEFRDRRRTIVVEVTTLIEKRVGAELAAACYEDQSPVVADPTPSGGELFGVRDRGSGRPTKRDRRAIERIRDDRR